MTPRPFVSVVMAVRNEEDSMERVLQALLSQDYPVDRYEIVIADGASSDSTASVIRHHMKTSRPPISLLPNPEVGVAPGLNAAILASGGEVLVRMDGHTVPERDYLRACVDSFVESDVGVVGGAMRPVGSDPWTRAIAAAMCSRIGAGDARFHVGGAAGTVETVYLGAFRREALKTSGLYDSGMQRNQDYELNARVRAAGFKVRFDPSIRSSYFPRASLRALMRQFFGYGWWRVETIRRHPWSLRWRQLLPPLAVGGILLAMCAAVTSRNSGLILAALGLVTSYVASVLIALLFERRALAELGRCWCCVVIMHWSYGFGFLCNILSGRRWPFVASAPRIAHLEG